MNIWLDDVRDPNKFKYNNYIWVKTVDETIAYLKTNQVNNLSLDHDLNLMDENGKEITGYDVILFLEQYPEYWPNKVDVHSANPVGVERMQVVINQHYR